MRFDISMDYIKSYKIKNNGGGNYTIKIIPLVDEEEIKIIVKLYGQMTYDPCLLGLYGPTYLEGSYTVDIMGNIVSIVKDMRYGWKTVGSLVPELQCPGMEPLVSYIINMYMSIYKNTDGCGS